MKFENKIIIRHPKLPKPEKLFAEKWWIGDVGHI